MDILTWLVGIVGTYLLVGILVAPIMAFYAVSLMDASAAHGSLGFRLIILPGLAALWPIMLAKAWKARHATYTLPVPEKPVSPRGLRSMHGAVIAILTLAAPVIALAALVWKASDFRDVPVATLPFTEAPRTSAAIRTPLPTHGSLHVSAHLISMPTLVGIGGPLEVELQLKSASTLTSTSTIATRAIYWSATSSPDETLPQDAVFVGTLRGPGAQCFPLPHSAALGKAGLLYVYKMSEGHGVEEIISLEGI